MLTPVNLCAFLLTGGILYDSGLDRDFRDKLIEANVLFILEFEDEWHKRMTMARKCDKLLCEASRKKAIDELTFKDVFILREPISKEKLKIFNC